MYSFLVTFILMIISLVCEGQHEKKCKVFPEDAYIPVGSNIEIVCQSYCIHGKVFWTLNNAPINENLSKSINTSHTALSLRNFTHYSATLQCHDADTQQVLGGTTIRTFTKPTKISCILHYKNQTDRGVPQLFTCSWEHQINFSKKINYTLLCASKSLSQSEICSSHVKTCTAEDVHLSGITPLIENITVTVKATTAVWEAYSDPYEFDPFQILKLPHPKLNVTGTSNHLIVEWTRTVTSRQSHCQVKYYKARDDRTQEKDTLPWISTVLNKTLKPYEKGNVTIGEVEFCTYYHVSVRCSLGKTWSDWSLEKTILTKLSKTDVKLHLWRAVTQQEKTGVRKIYIMWKDIPSTCPGTFTHSIKLIPDNHHMIGVNNMDTLCGNSTCEVNINQDAHRINLTVFSNGAFLKEDSVYVPATAETGLLQVTDLQTLILKGAILVSWKAPVQPVRGYMIDWTHDGNEYHWKESSHTNITLSGLLDKTAYNITVTPLFGDKTGHGTQALQICSRVGGPGDFSIINVQANDKSALVSWSMTSQEACRGAVVTYTVFYGTENRLQFNVTVNNTKQEVLLNDLHPDTQYSLFVKATALTGITTSSERHFRTKQFDPRLITALSVSGSIVIVLVLSLGICCVIWWNKFKEKPVPNPGLSSVALWPSPSHQKAICPFLPFSNPSESLCDRVYMEETQPASTHIPATGCNQHIPPTSDQTEENTEPAIVPVQTDIPKERSADPEVTVHQSSAGESRALLSSESCQLNPYRSQTSMETPAPRINRPSKHPLTQKHQEKTAPITVYVTLDLFDQGQGM